MSAGRSEPVRAIGDLMPLDHDIREYLARQEALELAPAWAVPIEQARRAGRAPHLIIRERTPVGSVEDRTVAGTAGELALRIYRPRGRGPHPAIVFLHGGGFVFGDLVTNDETCRRLCVAADAAVVAVDYRRAPEAPFPAAVDDAEAAVRWTAEHAAELGLDAERLAVAGDSAGGNLATVVARRARDAGRPALAGQLLIYPVTDMRPGDYPSRRECAHGYGLTQEAMEWFGRMYLPDRSRIDHPDASPIAADDLTGLPPAFVLTCEYDPLRDEGDRYAERLEEAGVAVEHHRLEGTIHGIFTIQEPLASRGEAWRLATRWLRRTLAPVATS